MSDSSNDSGESRAPTGGGSRRSVWLAALALVAAAFAAYHNSFSGPFIYDDLLAIGENPTIRSFREALSPPRSSGLPVEGRPVINLSLALNYAWGGTEVRGYHVVNFLIHALAGLALFGVIRRTLLRLRLRERLGTAALPLAWVTAALWLVHPLQTASVTYVSQRAEAAMALFYLLTLYAFIRATEGAVSRGWLGVAVGACLLGMGSKEVMVSAPLLVLLYDRTFVAGTFGEAWRTRRGFYLALAATWVLLAYLVFQTGSRGGTAGFGAGASWWAYSLVQFEAIVRYLRLAGWPHPLVFDYGTDAVANVARAAPFAAIVLGLAAATAVALRRWPAVGLAGAAFFALLAPSSSVVPVATETMAEHRMYLPLAAVLVVLMAGLYRALGRKALYAGAVLIVVLGALTVRRNEDYRSELAIWSDTVRKWPRNARAHFNVAGLLVEQGRFAEALPHYETTVRLRPTLAVAHSNLANVFSNLGRLPEALRHAEEAVRLQEELPEARAVLGNALLQLGRVEEAVVQYEAAVRLDPGSAAARNNLGTAWSQLGRLAEARARYEEALRLEPEYADAHFNLANTLVRMGRPGEAVAHYEATLRARPDYPRARENLARVQALIRGER